MKVTSRTERQAEGIGERILLEWMILYGNAYKVECMILYDNSEWNCCGMGFADSNDGRIAGSYGYFSTV